MPDTLNNIRKRAMAGITIVELIVVITVAGLLTGIVFGPLNDLYSSNVTTASRSAQDTYTRGVLRSIENELADAGGWTTSLSPPLGLGPLNNLLSLESWSYCGVSGILSCSSSTTNRVLITYTNATDKVSTDPTRLPIFDGTAGVCNTASTIVPIKAYRVYFVGPDATDASKNDLYRRTIVNPLGDVLCNGAIPIQKTTCAVALLSNLLCKDSSGASHADAVLLRDIKSFNVDYYPTPNSAAIANPYTAPASAIASAQAIRITVTTQWKAEGKTTTDTSDILISKLYQ